jgi:hypothetical protein
MVTKVVLDSNLHGGHGRGREQSVEGEIKMDRLVLCPGGLVERNFRVMNGFSYFLGWSHRIWKNAPSAALPKGEIDHACLVSS